MVAFPRCSQCSQQCLLSHSRGLVAQWCVQPAPSSLPSFPFQIIYEQKFPSAEAQETHTSFPQADCEDLWPTSCCRTHRDTPVPVPMYPDCWLRAEMLLVAQECGELPVLAPVPGFRKGVCCAGYRLFSISLSPPR